MAKRAMRMRPVQELSRSQLDWFGNLLHTCVGDLAEQKEDEADDDHLHGWHQFLVLVDMATSWTRNKTCQNPGRHNNYCGHHDASTVTTD